VHALGNMASGKHFIESGFEDNTVRVLTHVSAESVTCGVTVAIFGVPSNLWNDCTATVLSCSCPTACSYGYTCAPLAQARSPLFF